MPPNTVIPSDGRSSPGSLFIPDGMTESEAFVQ